MTTETTSGSMYLVKTPFYLKKIFSSMTWDFKSDEKILYLTFDDGPTPGVTDFVLEELQRADAEATFFCVGSNVEKHPEILERISKAGHSIGNHTYSHLNGWKSEDDNYFEDIERCKTLVASQLFRPPYGRIKISQIETLKKEYNIVMWDVISGDFDPKCNEEKVLENMISNAKQGSIIVMHDSLKAEAKIRYALPKLLDHFKADGYSFRKIEMTAPAG